jgi:hypothetical protein
MSKIISTPIDVAAAREQFVGLGKSYPPHPDVAVEPVVIAGVRCFWLTPDNVSGDEIVIYFHGGGYIYGSFASHGAMVSHIAHVRAKGAVRRLLVGAGTSVSEGNRGSGRGDQPVAPRRPNGAVRICRRQRRRRLGVRRRPRRASARRSSTGLPRSYLAVDGPVRPEPELCRQCGCGPDHHQRIFGIRSKAVPRRSLCE